MSLAFNLRGVPSGACPPKVVFKWRHFGKYSGVFTDKAGRRYKGNGQMVSSPAFLAFLRYNKTCSNSKGFRNLNTKPPALDRNAGQVGLGLQDPSTLAA